MNEPTAHTLTQRLDRVERELRWWRRGAASAMAVTVAVVLMGQALPQNPTVEAQKFVVKDATGMVRAELVGEANGPTSLHFYDQDGKRPVVMEWNPEDAAGFYLQSGTATVSLTTDGWPALYLGLESGKTGALLAHRNLTLYEDHETRAVLGQTEIEGALTGTLDKRSASSLVLFDRDGKVIWHVP